MSLLLIGWPLVMAGVVFLTPSNRWRPWLVPLTSLGHLLLVCRMLVDPPPPALGNWLVLDPLGKVFLGFVSVLFLLCCTYTAGYLAREQKRPNRVFCTCLLLSLSMMSLVILSHHLGLMWVAMEATTLAMAPNIFFYRTPRALEATWKYLLICSVGIALALLGSLFLAYSTLHTSTESSLLLEDLLIQGQGGKLARPWLHAAFVLFLIGYGTKMGLAPMHTWLPDAHGEAPAPVSALLSGALLPCAFLPILRMLHVCNASGEGPFIQPMLIFIGLLSMAVGAVFMVRQRDLKRLLAYSSVEHMGILVFGMAIGGLAIFGALLHMINNGLTKVALFLCAGNIQAAYGSRSTSEIRGVISRLPVTGALFLAAFLAITGSPPFGLFVSEFTILNTTFSSGHYLEGALLLLFLCIVFIGMGSTLLAVVQGTPSESASSADSRERLIATGPIVVAVGLVLLLGVFIPAPLDSLLREAAAFLEVKR